MVAEKQEDGSFIKRVVEIKSAYGFGADEFAKTFTIKDDYMAQLGLYLKDLDSKGVTNLGSFLFVLVSDKNFGTLVEVDCEYVREDNTIYARSAFTSLGDEVELSQKLSLDIVFERFAKLDEALAKKRCPPGEYVYKTPLTQELLDSLSDYKLRAMLQGERVEGSWRPKYSRYKDKQLAVDGISPGYTNEELGVIRKEYLERHPKSKL
jgi:hypothetical protein